jgi:hypothetical protein
MLNEKGRATLDIMFKNMIEINKKYQPKDGTDAELSKTIRILAETMAVLIKIILEADEVLTSTTARIDKETREDAARFLAMLREDDTYQS